MTLELRWTVIPDAECTVYLERLEKDRRHWSTCCKKWGNLSTWLPFQRSVQKVKTLKNPDICRKSWFSFYELLHSHWVLWQIFQQLGPNACRNSEYFFYFYWVTKNKLHNLFYSHKWVPKERLWWGKVMYDWQKTASSMLLLRSASRLHLTHTCSN